MRTPLAISFLSFVATVVLGSDAIAQDVVSASPDVTVELGSTSQTTADEDVAVDNLAGMVMLENLGALPRACDVTAYALLSNGDRLFACDTSIELPGPLFARRGDVVRFDGAAYVIEFDARAAGVPDGAVPDAAARGAGLLLSFDTTVGLGAVIADDEDLVRWDGASWSLAFDGSEAGIDAAIDVDAASYLGGESFALSFDASGSVGGIDFDDEDVLQYDGVIWTLALDGSALDSDWAGADLDAVALPEPGKLLSLVAGCSFLVAMGSRRYRPRSG